MNPLKEYANSIAKHANLTLTSGQFFVKVLTKNDDSGRHGVLIPSDAYLLFPVFKIQNPLENETLEFTSIEVQSGEERKLSYKYYQRYPERRITRLNSLINDQTQGKRLQIILCAKLSNGKTVYFHDATNEGSDGRFHALWKLFTEDQVESEFGTYVVVPIDFEGIQIDASLNELLHKFDSFQGNWIDSMRAGDTGIGYTLETLLGIKENNDKTADFQGIEIKSKRKKENLIQTSGKVNLFQQGPTWKNKLNSKERIRSIGIQNLDGLFTCYSQVTTKPNNLNLALQLHADQNKIDINKLNTSFGYWQYDTLETRLLEKHQRAAFILASEKNTKTKTTFCYEELIYCEQPSIERFVDLISQNQIVFEFTMSEKSDGSIRNHGYPWRLNRPALLDQLFAVRIKLR